MTIDLYYATLSAPCRAVLMTIKQLGLEVNIKHISPHSDDLKSPEFLKINPQHCVPTLIDDGFAIWESRAIMQYLVSKYAPNSGLYPTDLKKRAVVDRLMYYDMSINYAIRDAIMMKVMRGVDPPEQAIKNFENNFTILNTFIGDNKYVAGDKLTVADISYLSTLSYLQINDYKELENYPNIKRWYLRLQKELPYYDEVNGNVPELFKKFMESKKSN